MYKAAFATSLRSILVLMVAANTGVILRGQTNADTLKVIDQLIEQNRQLEKQNQQLIEQISMLRSSLVTQSSQPTAAPPKPVPAPEAPVPGGVMSAAERQSARDAEFQANELKEPKIWGLFNPGKGFTVARTESGELNLSGYIAVRYLNQLPRDQKGTDHL